MGFIRHNQIWFLPFTNFKLRKSRQFSFTDKWLLNSTNTKLCSRKRHNEYVCVRMKRRKSFSNHKFTIAWVSRRIARNKWFFEDHSRICEAFKSEYEYRITWPAHESNNSWQKHYLKMSLVSYLYVINLKLMGKVSIEIRLLVWYLFLFKNSNEWAYSAELQFHCNQFFFKESFEESINAQAHEFNKTLHRKYYERALHSFSLATSSPHTHERCFLICFQMTWQILIYL